MTLPLDARQKRPMFPTSEGVDQKDHFAHASQNAPSVYTFPHPKGHDPFSRYPKNLRQLLFINFNAHLIDLSSQVQTINRESETVIKHSNFLLIQEGPIPSAETSGTPEVLTDFEFGPDSLVPGFSVFFLLPVLMSSMTVASYPYCQCSLFSSPFTPDRMVYVNAEQRAADPHISPDNFTMAAIPSPNAELPRVEESVVVLRTSGRATLQTASSSNLLTNRFTCDPNTKLSLCHPYTKCPGAGCEQQRIAPHLRPFKPLPSSNNGFLESQPIVAGTPKP
ncbi:hypothetical protein BC332_30087 [Capsicum chinense]|nr:hypothetical protein BC332_30087 [Capsicum chinense]